MNNVRVLGVADFERVAALVDADPVVNAFFGSRLDSGVLSRRVPGEIWGYPADAPRALLHVGTNLAVTGVDTAAATAFAAKMGRRRTCAAIVGPVEQVDSLYRALSARHGLAYEQYRLLRRHQPLLATSSLCPVPEDHRVRPIGLDELDPYVEAAAAMYTEELGEDPRRTNPRGYRAYVRDLIESRRAFGIVQDGRVIFKTDIGGIGRGVAQIQGVWVAPDMRGRGMAPPAVASVSNMLVRSGLTSSLYVNDFNEPALATYRRCGFTQVGTLRTILY